MVLALLLSAKLINQLTDSKTPIAHNSKNNPDAFMVNAAYVSFDVTGKVHNQITMTKMTHLPANDMSEFTKPKIVIYDKDDQPWNIIADNGESQAGIEEVHLSNNVKVHQDAGKNNREITITTSHLTIFPQERIAITDQPITIIQPGEVINSVGLHADLKKSEVELLSKAHIDYQPDIVNKE